MVRSVTYPDRHKQKLPCFHKRFLEGMTYRGPDPQSVQVGPRGQREHRRNMDLLWTTRRAIITTDTLDTTRPMGDGYFKRTGYIGIFEVGNIVEAETGVQFDLVSRVISAE